MAPVAVGDTLILEFVGGDGEWRRFEVSVVEPLTDVTAALSSIDGGGALPPVGELLARTRLRIGYLDGPQLGSLAPLTVAVEANGEERLVTDEGCAGLEEPLDTEAEIERGTYVEGEICWPIPAIWVPDLLLVIEADRGERRWLALH